MKIHNNDSTCKIQSASQEKKSTLYAKYLLKNELRDVRLLAGSLAADLRLWLDWLRVTDEVGGASRYCGC